MPANKISYQLIRTKRKTLGLIIERDGTIIIRAPQDSPQKVIDDFFESKKFWMYKKLAEKKMIEEDLPSKEYVNGEGFLYLGKIYKDMIGVNPEIIRVLDLKYRWGSCSSKGNLNFHWKSILTPVPIVDYVVHELVHLKEKNHTQRFWEILAAILPDYEKRKEWLKVNGNHFEL